MSGMTVFALVNPSQFTGFEQTRVMDLITVLASASVVIWLIILLGVVVRHLVILGVAIATRRQRNRLLKRKLGV